MIEIRVIFSLIIVTAKINYFPLIGSTEGLMLPTHFFFMPPTLSLINVTTFSRV